MNTKTCVICGNEYHRPRYAGRFENGAAWRARTTCGGDCAKESARRTFASKTQARNQNTQHAPCEACGNPVARKSGEKIHRWLERKSCSEVCRRVLTSRGSAIAASYRVSTRPLSMSADAVRKREARRLARGQPKAPRVLPAVPERRVPFDRFPIPEGGKPAWVTVTGEGLPPVNWNNSVTSATLRPPNLADALDYHPDLRAALAGLLTDSWVPFSRGSGFKMHAAADAT